MKVKLQAHLCKLENSANLSAHDAIIGKVTFPLISKTKEEMDYSSSYTPFVVKKPTWNESGISGYQEQSAEVLQNLTSQFNQAEDIPILSELFSKMLVISAEKNFETITPKTRMKRKTAQKPFFSAQHKLAYESHEKICKDWRIQGRPQDVNHPAKIAKINSQRTLQRIAREEENVKAHQNHDDLMSTFHQNISQVCSKLRKIRGENSKTVNLPFINTLNGTYSGNNVLEGFCCNTETLCNDDIEPQDHAFYKMCVQDNMVIFDIACQEDIKVPHMTLGNLKDIIFKKLKLNKACDLYKLTVEHLRHAGDQTLSLVLYLLNSIIDNINHMSSAQLNTAVASIVYKAGKNKSVYEHKSYRQVRVSPLIGRCLDEFLRPNLIKITKPIQNSSQYGFTENVNYLMGALQRHEVEKFCVDTKKTFFGCSLDGESAFEVVDRGIQLRELYCAGERGEYN